MVAFAGHVSISTVRQWTSWIQLFFRSSLYKWIRSSFDKIYM